MPRFFRLTILSARRAIPYLAAVPCVAAALCFSATVSAQEPESDDARVTIMGVVYDVVTGTAIPTAAVSLENGRQGVLTDDQGIFRLEDVEAGPQLLVVTQFGYQKRAVAATITPESSGMMQVALTPRPIMLAGVTATVENVTEMEARLRFRRRAAGFATQAYDRRELFRAMTGTPLDFLNQRSMVRIVTCPPGAPASRCVFRRGRAIEPWVYVDEALAWGGLDELETYAVSDIYLMEVYSRGSEIRIYTNQFMEQMARKPMMPIPLNLWTRPAR